MTEIDEIDDRLRELKRAVEIAEVTDWPFSAHGHIEHMTDEFFCRDVPVSLTWPEQIRAIAHGKNVWPFTPDKRED